MEDFRRQGAFHRLHTLWSLIDETKYLLDFEKACEVLEIKSDLKNV